MSFGFERDDVVRALEEFKYDVDRAAELLMAVPDKTERVHRGDNLSSKFQDQLILFDFPFPDEMITAADTNSNAGNELDHRTPSSPEEELATYFDQSSLSLL